MLKVLGFQGYNNTTVLKIDFKLILKDIILLLQANKVKSKRGRMC